MWCIKIKDILIYRIEDKSLSSFKTLSWTFPRSLIVFLISFNRIVSGLSIVFHRVPFCLILESLSFSIPLLQVRLLRRKRPSTSLLERGHQGTRTCPPLLSRPLLLSRSFGNPFRNLR